ncbi:hypothetical protein ABFS82_07G016200 [Erythranthe guttata]
MSSSNNNHINSTSKRPIFSLRSTVDIDPEANDDDQRSRSTADTDQYSESRLLPIANVGRIMKQTLPNNAKISKEAKETMQECASEFIGFVTGEASEKCRKERRKTVNGDDICWAMGQLGFDDYVGPLKRYLIRFRDFEGNNNNNNNINNNININRVGVNIIDEEEMLMEEENNQKN